MNQPINNGHQENDSGFAVGRTLDRMDKARWIQLEKNIKYLDAIIVVRYF